MCILTYKSHTWCNVLDTLQPQSRNKASVQKAIIVSIKCVVCRNTNNANCALGTDRGTSMSTPVVAGAVALVRQYFMQGYYPTGAAVAANAFTPTGPLLKAVLLGELCNLFVKLHGFWT